MDNKHHGTAEEGTTETLFPKVAEEEYLNTETVSVLLLLHCGDSAEPRYLAVVCQLHSSRQKGTAEGH